MVYLAKGRRIGITEYFVFETDMTEQTQLQNDTSQWGTR